MNIDQYSPQSGRFLKEDGTYVNIADALGGTETGQTADIEKYTPHTGRFIKEDGTVINIAENIGGGGSGSSDDSAPPIVEVYNGQTIQCSMSADRPLKGLNLYATTEQVATTGAQLFDASLMPTTSKGGATVTNNGDGSFTISGEGQITEEGFISSISVSGDDARKMLKVGNIYTNGMGYIPMFYAYGQDDTGKILFNTSTATGSAVITDEILENLSQLRVVFFSVEGYVITPATFFPMIWQTGDGTYEPYTGGKPSPSPEYPQEIQSTSDFTVEVKNSMEAGTMPQTLNVTIPEQGFYGIPVSNGGNYTDTSGQQWVCDEFDFANKKFIKRTGRISYDGSEDERWMRGLTTAGILRFGILIADGGEKNTSCLCDRLIYKVANELGVCFMSNSTLYIYLAQNIDTEELLREYLSTHQLDVIYPLETPAEYDLTDEQVEQYKKLRSCYGTTYIDNDAVPVCNMQAELVLDTKLYIDSKFATLAGQILEVGA